MWKNFIQIAGVKNAKEAEMLIESGVKFIGFPLRLTVNAEDTTEEEAKEIITKIKDKASPVLITYLSEANEIKDFSEYLGIKIVQLHGDITIEELQKLNEISPDLIVIKSLVIGKSDFSLIIRTVEELSPYVNAFITDTFNPATGAEGATGLTHDWELSKKIVEVSSRPVILAGGLMPANVKEAILKVKPAGVDSHTGVEDENGNKDLAKVKEFVFLANQAFELLK